MRVGIHVDPNRGQTRELGRYAAILDYNGIEYRWLDASKSDFWKSVSEVDLFIFHWIGTSLQEQMAPAILPIVEKEMGIRCFPDSATSWPYDDKVREYYLLKQHGFPVIPTWVFWNREIALEWLDQASFPLVFKLKSGASSVNVALVKDRGTAKNLVMKMFGRGIMSEHVPGLSSLKWKEPMKNLRYYKAKIGRRIRREEVAPYERLHKNYILFQEFLPDNTFDTRVTIIGDRAFFSRRYVRKGDFRASGSGHDDHGNHIVDRDFMKIAFEVSRKLKYTMMSYDFLYGRNKTPLISEMSYTSPDWSVWSCQGFWSEDLSWHGGYFWPQYCVLMDILRMPELKQPEMKR